MDAPRSAIDSRSGALGPGALLLASWTLLAVGVANSNGHYDARSLAAVVVGWVFAGVGLWRLAADRPAGPRSDERHGLRTALALAVGAALASSLAYPAGIYGVDPALSIARGLVMLAALIALATVFGGRRARPITGVATIAIATAASVAMIVASPRPSIDVWFFLTQGAEWTVRGANAYAQCWVDNTDPLTNCLYPYLPGQLLVDIPFLVGDVRYSSVTALMVAALAVWRVGSPALAPALAALLLLQPQGLFLVEQAWTEPVLLAAVCVMVWAVLAGRAAIGIVAFAVALACKQHMVLLLPFAAWWPAFGVRRTAIAVALAGAVTLPWVLTAPYDFWADAVLYSLLLPPRPDSLSLYSWVLELGLQPPFVLVALATVAVVVACLVRLPRDARGFCAGSVFVLLTFTVLNKQSFFNHYSLVIGLLVLTVAVTSRTSGFGRPAGALVAPT